MLKKMDILILTNFCAIIYLIGSVNLQSSASEMGTCALFLCTSASKFWAHSVHGNVGLNITHTPESGLG